MSDTVDARFLESVRSSFGWGDAGSLILGAPVHAGLCVPEPLVRIPLAMANRHGLIAGATGTGKTRTLQLLAEQFSASGVPVFLADIKGDLTGLAAEAALNDRIAERSRQTGHAWKPLSCPVELLSLSGRSGAQVRATVSSFGPLLLSKVLSLNDAQSGALSLVFKLCDDRKLPLLDFTDLRAVLQYLTGDGAAELKDYGGIAKVTAGVLLRKMVELEQQGGEVFFGEPEFDLDDLMVTRDGRGLVSILELSDFHDRPALFSTFMMWFLARLYHELPEVGDLEKPKLVFFFDEAHLLFEDARKAFLESVDKVVRLIRSKGVGVYFVTQSPKDVPAEILGQLGHRVQHALRAYTPEDDAALRAAARTFPKTEHYDIEETLTVLGTGEALVTVLSPKGVPTAPVATKLIAPGALMTPLPDGELARLLASSDQVRDYAEAIDRESAREILAARMAREAPVEKGPAGRGGGRRKRERSTLEEILRAPTTRTVAGQVVRGLMGALLGGSSRRRR